MDGNQPSPPCCCTHPHLVPSEWWPQWGPNLPLLRWWGMTSVDLKVERKQKVAMMYLIQTHELQWFRTFQKEMALKGTLTAPSSLKVGMVVIWGMPVLQKELQQRCRRHTKKHFLFHWVSQSNFFKHPRWVNWTNHKLLHHLITSHITFQKMFHLLADFFSFS